MEDTGVRDRVFTVAVIGYYLSSFSFRRALSTFSPAKQSGSLMTILIRSRILIQRFNDATRKRTQRENMGCRSRIRESREKGRDGGSREGHETGFPIYEINVSAGLTSHTGAGGKERRTLVAERERMKGVACPSSMDGHDKRAPSVPLVGLRSFHFPCAQIIGVLCVIGPPCAGAVH